MKITGIEIKQYAKPLDPPFLASWDPNPRVKFASTIVYVYTDEGDVYKRQLKAKAEMMKRMDVEEVGVGLALEMETAGR